MGDCPLDMTHVCYVAFTGVVIGLKGAEPGAHTRGPYC